jgi:hypothetical protein
VAWSKASVTVDVEITGYGSLASTLSVPVSHHLLHRQRWLRHHWFQLSHGWRLATRVSVAWALAVGQAVLADEEH